MVKRNANDVAYLVRRGQNKFIEEDGRGRNRIILIATARSQSRERLKSPPTLPAILGVSESKGRVSPFMDEIKGRGFTNRCRYR